MKPKEKPMSKPLHDTPDFAEFITDLANGKVSQKLTEKIAEVAAAVEETGKVGEINIKIQIKKEGTVAVVGTEIKTKIPEHPIHGTLFHFGENGTLLREDPKQMTLKNLDPKPLRAVDDGDDGTEGGGENAN